MVFNFGKNKTLTIVVTVLIEAGLTLIATAAAKGSFAAFVGNVVIIHVAIVAVIIFVFVCWVIGAVIGAKLRGDKVILRFGFRRRPARPTRR